MHIAIVGTGGVGGYFGGLLAKAGNNVTFVARGAQLEALKQRGLRVKSVMGDFLIQPVKVVESVKELDQPDLVLFTVKTYDTASVARELQSVVTPATIIITFQNGVQNDLEIKRYLPTTQVYPGVCYLISARTQPGVIEQTGGLRKLIFGDRQHPQNAALQQIATLLQAAEINAVTSDTITQDLWKKFIFITAFSGMTALKRQTIGEILSDVGSVAQYEQVVKESIAVAERLQITLPENIFDLTMTTTRNTAPASKSSLLLDIEQGRKTEIETLNGTLVRLAREAGVAVPMNQKIYEAIK